MANLVTCRSGHKYDQSGHEKVVRSLTDQSGIQLYKRSVRSIIWSVKSLKDQLYESDIAKVNAATVDGSSLIIASKNSRQQL